MTKTLPCYLVYSMLVLLACSSSYVQHEQAIAGEAKIVKHTYDTLSVAAFFPKLAFNHQQDFYQRDSVSYLSFCRNFNLVPNDSAVKRKYFRFVILHALFTSSGASNGNRGDILNIPYLWHWVEPNPRHEIVLLENGKKLSGIKPPKNFSKYSTFADIDRTPSLFLGDLVQATPKYFLSYTDTFATFGWCSEREMAFVCLMEILGHKGKVMVSGNHSWSEFLESFHNRKGASVTVHFKVDNTFNILETDTANKEKMSLFNKPDGSGLKAWYNIKSDEASEKQRVSALRVPKTVSEAIENKVCSYLRTH